MPCKLTTHRTKHMVMQRMLWTTSKTLSRRSDFLFNVVTGDESGYIIFTLKTKRQSLECCQYDSLASKKFRTQLSEKKTSLYSFLQRQTCVHHWVPGSCDDFEFCVVHRDFKTIEKTCVSCLKIHLANHSAVQWCSVTHITRYSQHTSEFDFWTSLTPSILTGHGACDFIFFLYLKGNLKGIHLNTCDEVNNNVTSWI